MYGNSKKKRKNRLPEESQYNKRERKKTDKVIKMVRFPSKYIQ